MPATCRVSSLLIRKQWGLGDASHWVTWHLFLPFLVFSSHLPPGVCTFQTQCRHVNLCLRLCFLGDATILVKGLMPVSGMNASVHLDLQSSRQGGLLSVPGCGALTSLLEQSQLLVIRMWSVVWRGGTRVLIPLSEVPGSHRVLAYLGGARSPLLIHPVKPSWHAILTQVSLGNPGLSAS